MCDCKEKIEAKLLEAFMAEAADATGHEVSLEGYSFSLRNNVVTLRPFAAYKTCARFPLKKGGFKRKVRTGFMGFSFCPYCGEKLAGAA